MPVHILQLPPDASGVERRIIEYAYAHIYRTLSDPLDKFIVAFMFDLGNNVTATSIATGLHRKTVWEKKKKIQGLLRNLKVPVETFVE
jgi:hypothetical protein